MIKGSIPQEDVTIVNIYAPTLEQNWQPPSPPPPSPLKKQQTNEILYSQKNEQRLSFGSIAWA